MTALQIKFRKPPKRKTHERVILPISEENGVENDKKRFKLNGSPEKHAEIGSDAKNEEPLFDKHILNTEHTDGSLDSFIADLPASTTNATPTLFNTDDWDDQSSTKGEANVLSKNSLVRSKASPKSKLDKIKSKHSTFPFIRNLTQQHYNTSPTDSELPANFRELYDVHIESIDDQQTDLDDKTWTPVLDWNEAGLPLPFMKVIKTLHYDSPTPVQSQCLPIIMSGHDLVGIAPTGSGKTAAFLIPMSRHIAANRETYLKNTSGGPYAVVLVPTRELCVQISSELEPWTEALRLTSLSCYGGSNIAKQISQLKSGHCDVIVATPGRLIDLLAANNGRVLSLESVTYLVVDETDRMFDLGFGPQVKKIVESMRPDRQTIVFSATMLPAMEVLVDRILDRPVKVTIGARSKVPGNVEQRVKLIEPDRKFDTLLETLRDHNGGSAVIFVNTQAHADMLNVRLLSKGINCQTLHGGMDQRDREDVIIEFKSGNLPVLIATSVAARGLDVKHLTLVVNYDAASHHEDYVHRAGRTGRAGKTGLCVTFLEPSQLRESYQLSTSTSFDDPRIQQMAESYANTAEKNSSKRFGFGGHGLAKLESKWNLQKSVEQGAYTSETGDERTQTSENEVEILKQGTAYFAFISINDAPKEARIAVTATSLHNEIITKYHVSLTLKGVYMPNAKPTTPKESKLGIQIESTSKEDVLSAYEELHRILVDKTTEAALSGKYSSF